MPNLETSILADIQYPDYVAIIYEGNKKAVIAPAKVTVEK